MKVLTNDLLPVYETDQGERIVDGRELHEFLKVGRDFTSWIKNRIEKYGFVEGDDFALTLTKTGERQNVIQHDYILKLDTAKELCMVENNAKGREARRYFIEVEKKFKSAYVPSYMIDDPVKRAQKWIEEQRAKQEVETKALMLEQRVAEYEPKISYLDQILKSKGTVTITQIAKDYGMSGKALNEILHEERVQFKQNKQWLLYRDYHDKGYTKSETIDITRSNGDPDVTMNTRWTQKGRLFIHELLKKRGVLALMDRENESRLA
ncbi:anti-repressor protein [Paenibacillus phage PG1]|uniref:anti-repressor Ant n=1 Tax=Paenibacillus phage PG1 TaxID=754053 RepID=UPI0003428F0C|nr:anti-repressor Ant [Paenibacillus phage PG1]AGN33748.1 anti-repressor protein [Paenibacillus phage PG1]